MAYYVQEINSGYLYSKRDNKSNHILTSNIEEAKKYNRLGDAKRATTLLNQHINERLNSGYEYQIITM